MARSKEYEPGDMVQKVKAAFIEDGYRSLGIRSIEEKTGLGRFAIRTQFGGKEGLMLAAMKSYREDAERYVFGPMRDASDASALTAMLEGIVTPHPETLRKHGCLMVNSTVERLGEDSDAFADMIAGHFDNLRDETIALIKRGQSQGRIKTTLDPKEAADFVVGCVMSTNLLNRAARDETAAKSFVAQAVKAIEAWAA